MLIKFYRFFRMEVTVFDHYPLLVGWNVLKVVLNQDKLLDDWNKGFVCLVVRYWLLVGFEMNCFDLRLMSCRFGNLLLLFQFLNTKNHVIHQHLMAEFYVQIPATKTSKYQNDLHPLSSTFPAFIFTQEYLSTFTISQASYQPVQFILSSDFQTCLHQIDLQCHLYSQ